MQSIYFTIIVFLPSMYYTYTFLCYFNPFTIDNIPKRHQTNANRNRREKKNTYNLQFVCITRNDHNIALLPLQLEHFAHKLFTIGYSPQLQGKILMPICWHRHTQTHSTHKNTFCSSLYSTLFFFKILSYKFSVHVKMLHGSPFYMKPFTYIRQNQNTALPNASFHFYYCFVWSFSPNHFLYIFICLPTTIFFLPAIFRIQNMCIAIFDQLVSNLD